MIRSVFCRIQSGEECRCKIPEAQIFSRFMLLDCTNREIREENKEEEAEVLVLRDRQQGLGQ